MLDKCQKRCRNNIALSLMISLIQTQFNPRHIISDMTVTASDSIATIYEIKYYLTVGSYKFSACILKECWHQISTSLTKLCGTSLDSGCKKMLYQSGIAVFKTSTGLMRNLIHLLYQKSV